MSTTVPWWQLDWVWQAAGWTLAAAGVAVLVWSLFWDRARGRRRCPGCWYDLSGSVAAGTLICPECGRAIKHERRLLHTRRRWRWAAVAILLLVASWPVMHAARIGRVGWRGAIPTTALIYWVSRNEPPEKYDGTAMSKPTPYAAELARRAGTGELWGWQYRVMLRRLHVIRWRERWPADARWKVSLNVPSWLRSSCKVTAELPEHLYHSQTYPPDPNAKVRAIPGIGIPVNTQPLPPSTKAVTIDVSAGSWKGPLDLPVQLVDRVDQAIITVSTPEIDKAVRNALETGISRDNNAATGTNLMLGARVFRDKGQLPNDLSVGLTVELMRDGVIVQSWPLSLADSAFGPPVDWIRIKMPDPGWNTADSDDMKRWTVRVRGDPTVSLGDFQRERCWNGEYTVPLAEYLR